MSFNLSNGGEFSRIWILRTVSKIKKGSIRHSFSCVHTLNELGSFISSRRGSAVIEMYKNAWCTYKA